MLAPDGAIIQPADCGTPCHSPPGVMGGAASFRQVCFKDHMLISAVEPRTQRKAEAAQHALSTGVGLQSASTLVFLFEFSQP